jgi:hypothetical protein
MGRVDLIHQIYSEVIYETQSPFVVLERSCDRGLLQAAVDVTQCSFGFRDHGTGGTGFKLLELDAERASGRPVGPGQPTAGFVQQRHHDAATG